MLFRNNIPQSCALCQRALRINETDMLCEKRGVVRAAYSCRKFRYDPVKRVPAPKVKADTDYDFNLD